MAASGGARGTRGRSGPKVSSRPAARLSRASLEEAFARLTEENARLRREVTSHNDLWEIAHRDPLTDLWNRRYADGRLAEELSRAQREGGYRFSLVLIDVDNMKRINDQLGHASGDEALKWVARFLSQGLRTHDLCCRLGGDEFLLILPGSGVQDCHDLVGRLRRRWNAAADGDHAAVPISVGTASFPDQGQTVESLFTVADDAMYANKRRQDPSRPARRVRTARRSASTPRDPSAAATSLAAIAAAAARAGVVVVPAPKTRPRATRLASY